jgi:hypothetical protein
MAKGDKAKKKAKSGGADEIQVKIKVPKEVGGVKVPKQLRKAGKQALKLAQEPVVSEVVAGALLAAAAALRAPAGEKGLAAAAAAGAVDAARKSKTDTGLVGKALKAMALDMARRTIEGIEENRKQRKSAREEGDDAGSDAGAPVVGDAGPEIAPAAAARADSADAQG